MLLFLEKNIEKNIVIFCLLFYQTMMDYGYTCIHACVAAIFRGWLAAVIVYKVIVVNRYPIVW